MEQNKIRGEWAGSSNLKHRREELLQAHKEFLEMLADGYKIKEVRVKRPRIKKDKFKVIITCFGPMKITIEEFNEHCKDFKTI